MVGQVRPGDERRPAERLTGAATDQDGVERVDPATYAGQLGDDPWIVRAAEAVHTELDQSFVGDRGINGENRVAGERHDRLHTWPPGRHPSPAAVHRRKAARGRVGEDRGERMHGLRRGQHGAMIAAMREAYAHEALLTMDKSADPRAPGAAVTVALCGHWEHEPPCPLAPHRTDVGRVEDDGLAVRILFAADPGAEGEVRRRIDAALAGGHLTGPDGVDTTWQLRTSGVSDVQEDEAEQAGRLLNS